MGTWILIVIVLAENVRGYTTHIEFSSKEACEAASAKIEVETTKGTPSRWINPLFTTCVAK